MAFETGVFSVGALAFPFMAIHALFVECVHAFQYEVFGLDIMTLSAGREIPAVLGHVHSLVARCATGQSLVEHVFMAALATLVCGHGQTRDFVAFHVFVTFAALAGFGFDVFAMVAGLTVVVGKFDVFVMIEYEVFIFNVVTLYTVLFFRE
jgi:hypothetical protein